MRVTNLVEAYREHVIDRDSPADYEQLRPALFEHYHRFWSERRPYAKDRDPAKLRCNRVLIQSSLDRLEAQCAMHGLNIAELEVVLFVGHGTTNGHAYLEDGRFVVWIPVETYSDERLANVFLTHEIIHALHYLASPSFYFDDTSQQSRMARLLITEGVATYLTCAILNVTLEEALWGGYLPEDKLAKWMEQAGRRFGEMCSFFQQNFDASIREHGLFCLKDTSDVFQSRGGYYVGARIIKAVTDAPGVRPLDLLRADYPGLEEKVRGQLAG